MWDKLCVELLPGWRKTAGQIDVQVVVKAYEPAI